MPARRKALLGEFPFDDVPEGWHHRHEGIAVELRNLGPWRIRPASWYAETEAAVLAV
ncbi:unnamed protein product, partial [marine sediment metagenome]